MRLFQSSPEFENKFKMGPSKKKIKKTLRFVATVRGSYTFITEVSCSSELCGRMALLFECSFSRFCRKPLLFRPSRMTALLEARLMRVLRGGEREQRAHEVDNHSPVRLSQQGDVLMRPICPPT